MEVITMKKPYIWMRAVWNNDSARIMLHEVITMKNCT